MSGRPQTLASLLLGSREEVRRDLERQWLGAGPPGGSWPAANGATNGATNGTQASNGAPAVNGNGTHGAHASNGRNGVHGTDEKGKHRQDVPAANGTRGTNGAHAAEAANVAHERAADADPLLAAMTDEELVQRRLHALPRKLVELLDTFLAEPGGGRTVREAVRARSKSFQSQFEVEAALAALMREGFLLKASGRAWDALDEPGHAVPGELLACIVKLRRRQRSELSDAITLKGFLQSRHYASGASRRGDAHKAADHARKVYKIYLMESSMRSRIKSLPGAVREVFERAVTSYGGLMPASELSGDEGTDLDAIKIALENAMLGTVGELRLARFGIQPESAVIVVFHEVVLICLPWFSAERPPVVEEVLNGSVDLVSNVSLFLRKLGSSRVQVTAEGNLYKTTEKRIADALLASGGHFLGCEAQVRLVYRFCVARRLIERSGEGCLQATPAGHDFDALPLPEKLRHLLAYCVEERGLPGEHFHQVRLRRILLRLLRRVHPEQWHEALFLPFLARNGYLTTLDGLNAEEMFAARFVGGGYTPTESLAQICRNLLLFVKQRLHPLGLVDLGLRAGKPAALRLSRLGADLLGAETAADVGGARSTLIVNPDFEVIVFPGDDVHDVVHTFDHFMVRTKSDHTHHFRLSRDSVQGGLRQGFTVTRIVDELTDRSRAPLPQNVLYSLQDWGDQAGVVVLVNGSLRAHRKEQLDRVLGLPQVGGLVAARVSPTEARLSRGVVREKLKVLLTDLGFVVEELRE